MTDHKGALGSIARWLMHGTQLTLTMIQLFKCGSDKHVLHICKQPVN